MWAWLKNNARLIAIAALIVILLYALWLYVVPWLPAAAVLAYLFAAVLMFRYHLLAGRERRTQQQREAVHRNLSTALEFYRDHVGRLIGMLATALIWPVPLAREIWIEARAGANDTRQVEPYEALRLAGPFQSLAVLGWILLSISLAQIWFIGNAYPRIFVFTLLVSIFLKQIALIVIPGGLPGILRRKTARPYVAFLVILFLDAAALFIACHYLRMLDLSGAAAGGLGQLLDTAALQHTVELLLNPAPLGQRIMNIIGGHRIQQPDVGLAVVSAVGYVSLGKYFWDIRTFTVQDADRAAKAELDVKRGHLRKAVRHLDEISQKNKTPRVLLLHSLALIALFQFNRAKPRAEEALKTALKGGSASADDQLYSVLLDWATTIIPLPQTACIELLKSAANNRVSDWLLATKVARLLDSPHQAGGAPADAKAIAEQLMQRVPAGPRTRAIMKPIVTTAVRVLAPPRQVNGRLAGANALAEQLELQLAARLVTAPLTAAAIKIRLGQFDGARARLGAMHPGCPIEMFLYQVLLLQMVISDPDTSPNEKKVHFSNWANSAVPVLVIEATELTEWHEQRAALMELNVLRKNARRLEHGWEEMFVYVTDVLAHNLRAVDGLDELGLGPE
jgi:hypothetical protein